MTCELPGTSLEVPERLRDGNEGVPGATQGVFSSPQDIIMGMAHGVFTLRGRSGTTPTGVAGGGGVSIMVLAWNRSVLFRASERSRRTKGEAKVKDWLCMATPCKADFSPRDFPFSQRLNA